MRLFLIQLFVFTTSVICINENDKYDRRVVQGKYNLNHPTWAEDHKPIPVAVVYEDDIITGKNNKLKVEQNYKVKPDEEENRTNKVREESITTERIKMSRTIKKSGTDSEQDDIPVNLKVRTLGELQIPVAVVYDDEQAKESDIKNTRRRYKKIRRRKQQDKTSINNEKREIQNTKPANSQIQTETKHVDPVKPQPRQKEPISSRSQSVSQKSVPIEMNTRAQNKRKRDPVVPIIQSESYVFSHSGNFHYSYEGGDGTKAHSEGKMMRNSNNEADGTAVSGGFSYTDKEGNDFSISYTADENGYRPVGAHLPTPPPIPPAIVRALAYLATATTPEPVTRPSVKHTKQYDRKPNTRSASKTLTNTNT